MAPDIQKENIVLGINAEPQGGFGKLEILQTTSVVAIGTLWNVGRGRVKCRIGRMTQIAVVMC